MDELKLQPIQGVTGVSAVDHQPLKRKRAKIRRKRNLDDSEESDLLQGDEQTEPHIVDSRV